MGMAPRFLRRLFVSPIEELGALAEELLSERGEASGVALARELLDAYAAAGADVKLAFLILLAQRFGAEPERIERAIAKYQEAPGAETARQLHEAAEPRLQEFLRRLNLAPGGIAVLVRMREDVLKNISRHPELKQVDADFRHLFISWFNRGFLVLRRIDWSTPASILDKIILHEAVHEITDWSDLRRRLDPGDRKCFAFFHPTLVDDPLIFVEVALTRAIPHAIASLLAESRSPIDPERASMAVFYSISNCQVGLQGVSFGDFLIKQVVEELRRELPQLKTFVTLSPVPGFGAWLRRERESVAQGALTAADKEALRALDLSDWHRSANADTALQPVLARALCNYFFAAKNAAGKPLDPVARFHLNNGARLERLNWLGDVSAKGLREAAGFMVNYLYDLDDMEENHDAFASRGEVAASRQVRLLVARKRAADA